MYDQYKALNDIYCFFYMEKLTFEVKHRNVWKLHFYD